MKAKPKKLLLSIEPEMLAGIAAVARQNRVSRSWVIREVLRGWIQSNCPLATEGGQRDEREPCHEH